MPRDDFRLSSQQYVLLSSRLGLFATTTRSYSMGHHDGSQILSESREFARRGDFSKASQLATAFLKEGQQEPLDAATYAGLIEVFSRAKRLDKARHVLEEMKSKGTTSETLHFIMRTC
jgi:pentatricopeptide repeat protein